MAKKGFWDRAIEATPLGLSQMRWNQENARRNEELGMAREEHDRTMQGLDITRERDSLKLMAEQEAKAMADDTKRLRLSNYDYDTAVELLNKGLPENANLSYSYETSEPDRTSGERSSVLFMTHTDPVTGKEEKQTVAVCPTKDCWMATVNTLVWGEDYQRARIKNKMDADKAEAEIAEKRASAKEKLAGAKEKEAGAYKAIVEANRPRPVSLQRKTRKFIDERGVQMGQEENFNPETGESEPYGKPYQVAQDPNSEVNEGAVQALANIFIQTGKFPSLGMGMGKLRGKALERAYEMLKQQGVDPMDMPGIQAEYTANSQSLSTVKKAYNQVMAFEKTASKNLDYATELSDKYSRGRFPSFNAMMNAVKSETGDPEIEALKQAIYTASMEYMKVITAGSGVSSSELSVGAQKKAEEILNSAKTMKQFQSIIKSMRVDMENRQDAYLEQISELQASLKPFRGIKMPESDTKTEPETEPKSKFTVLEVK